MSNNIVQIPISVGELIDKLSILQVKRTKIDDEKKLKYVNSEFELLYNLSTEFLNNMEIENLYHDLVDVNSSLWDIEDEIRDLEHKNIFDNQFVSVARKVYKLNDLRFEVKNKINETYKSTIREVKNYKKY